MKEETEENVKEETQEVPKDQRSAHKQSGLSQKRVIQQEHFQQDGYISTSRHMNQNMTFVLLLC